MDVENRRLIERSGIGGLTASFGIEAGPVKQDTEPSVSGGFTAKDPRGKFDAVGFLAVEKTCGHLFHVPFGIGFDGVKTKEDFSRPS